MENRNKGSTGEHSIEKIQGKKFAVKCESQAEWDKISELLERNWSSKTYWDLYKSDTCISCNADEYSNSRYWQSVGYTIIPASKVIADNIQPIDGYQIGDWVKVVVFTDSLYNQVLKFVKGYDDGSCNLTSGKNPKRNRSTMLNKKSIDWSALAQKDKEIDGYEEGLKALKSFRTVYFPNWRELITQD